MAYDNNNYQTPNASTHLMSFFGPVSMVNLGLFNDRFTFSFANKSGESQYGRPTYDTSHKYTITLTMRHAATLIQAYEKHMKAKVESNELPDEPISVSVLVNTQNHGFVRHMIWYGDRGDGIPSTRYIVIDNLGAIGEKTNETRIHDFVFDIISCDMAVDPDSESDYTATVTEIYNSDFVMFIDILRCWTKLLPFDVHGRRNSARFANTQKDQLHGNGGHGGSNAPQFSGINYQMPNPAEIPANMPMGDELPFTDGDGFY